MTEDELSIVKPIIESNDFSMIDSFSNNSRIKNVIRYYKITRNDAEAQMLVSNKTWDEDN